MRSIFRKACLVLLTAASIPLYAGPDTFLTEAGQYHLVFTLPDNFAETPVIANNDLTYDYAVKTGSPLFEIRYILKPDSHVGLKTFAPAMATQIVGTGNLQNAKRFDAQEAQTQFGADEGLAMTIEGIDPEFGQGYKNCVFLAIQKSGSGQAYVFFLFNDPKEAEELLKSTFHSLKFGETPGS